MQVEDLIRVLEGEITHILRVNMRDETLDNVEIPVSPTHLKTILQAFLDGDINDESVNAWAKFVSLRGEFVTLLIDETDPKYDDYYEDMWTVISYLCTPQIDGDITYESVKEYRGMIEKYFDSDGNEIDYRTLN